MSYSASELRDAMTFYNVPGRADIDAIANFDALEGDGIDSGTEGHGANLGDVNSHTLQRFDGDLGFPRFEGEALSGCDVFGEDDPSPFAADYFGGDETAAGQWAETMLSADILGEDDLYMLGWDPFKSIKKAVKPLAKTAKAAVKKVEKAATQAGKMTSKVAKAVGKVPVVGKLAESGLRTAGAVGKASLRLNPVVLLSNPKKALQAQVAAAKSVVSTAKQSVGVAKQLVKSPVVKTVVGGAALVFPPVGVPAAAALATAAAVANAVDSKVPAARAAALKVVENTTKLAKAGDKGAEIALSQIATQKKALLVDKLKTAPDGSKRLIFDVSRTGNVSQVTL